MPRVDSSPVLLLALMVTACAAAPALPALPALTAMPPALDAFETTDDPSALTASLGAPGKGGLSTGRTYRVVKPITVYRLYSAAGKPKAEAFGRWWSLD